MLNIYLILVGSEKSLCHYAMKRTSSPSRFPHTDGRLRNLCYTTFKLTRLTAAQSAGSRHIILNAWMSCVRYNFDIAFSRLYKYVYTFLVRVCVHRKWLTAPVVSFSCVFVQFLGPIIPVTQFSVVACIVRGLVHILLGTCYTLIGAVHSVAPPTSTDASQNCITAVRPVRPDIVSLTFDLCPPEQGCS
jgi:hypothetical protein